MKKAALALAILALVTSCKNLADNEYEINGSVDPSWEGRVISLEKQNIMGGSTVLDTVKIKDAAFTFHDTITQPGIYFLRVPERPGELVDFIVEPGEIEIEVDKDTLQKSVVKGTYNNEKYVEFKNLYKKGMTAVQMFEKQNMQKYNEAKAKGDIETVTKLENGRVEELKKLDNTIVKFIEDSPKAYVSLHALGEVSRFAIRKQDEIKSLFNGLDASVKNSREGKIIEGYINPEKTTAAAPAPKATINVGDKAPDFTAKTPDDKDLSLKEVLGKKATIIDFWASWCGPCRKENPHIVALYKKYHDKGLNIIGVSLDKEESAWKNAIAKDQLNWFHVSNLKFWDEPIAHLYGVEQIPAPFLLDAEGKVIARDLYGEQLETEVAKLVK